MSRGKSLLRGLGLAALGGATAFAGGMVRQAYQKPQVSRYRVPLRGLTRPLRVVQMSDLHTGLYIHEETLERWVTLANAQRPDLIVITGDFVDRFSIAPLPGLERAPVETPRAPRRLGRVGQPRPLAF